MDNQVSTLLEPNECFNINNFNKFMPTRKQRWRYHKLEEIDVKITGQRDQYHIVSKSNRVTNIRNRHPLLTVLDTQVRYLQGIPNFRDHVI